MDILPLPASARDVKVNVKALRRQGKVPAVVYGSGFKPTTIACDQRTLHKTFVRAGESTLVELDVDGKKIPVLFKEVSFDPVSGTEIHADFYAVNMKKEIETQIPVCFEGEAPGVKELGAIFVSVHDHVVVRCLPKNLPHVLTVSIGGLQNFHDVLSVKDIPVPDGVVILDPPDTVIATIQEPRKEEEIAPPPTPEAAAAGTPAGGAAPAEGAPVAAAPEGEKVEKKEGRK